VGPVVPVPPDAPVLQELPAIPVGPVHPVIPVIPVEPVFPICPMGPGIAIGSEHSPRIFRSSNVSLDTDMIPYNDLIFLILFFADSNKYNWYVYLNIFCIYLLLDRFV
jgi:hypothetical protein